VSDPIVATTSGQVRGQVANGVRKFLGVPYAAGPVGERRFKAPQPYPAWEGVRDATWPAPNAPQHSRPFPNLDITPFVGAGWIKGDDYLNVSIWTPDIGTKEAEANRLPVMVWIHGGAFIGGSNSAPVSDGGAYARAGVVMMAVNYRMGIDGFLPIPGAPTNLGLRDMIAALQWVKANAAAFGGDPDNVTVFGESAGAMAIGDLIVSPLAKGLFKRAIIESGHGAMVRSIAVGQRVVKQIAKLAGVKPTLEAFKTLSFDQCIDAVVKIHEPKVKIDVREADGRDPAFGLSRFLPVYGDDVLPEKPHDALRKGAGKDIDVLIGSNREEMNLYFVPLGVLPKLNGFLTWLILKKVEPKAGPILKAYKNSGPRRRGGAVFCDAMTDLVFRLPARRFAAAHQGTTHLYEFDWRSPACNGELGAAHGVELPFVFNTLAICSGPKGVVGENPPQALADRMQGLWASFAKGEPLPWSKYDTAGRQAYSLEKGYAGADPVMAAEAVYPLT
jgi:para-nitrobenzyl esterase